jgi:hypothetical protein
MTNGTRIYAAVADALSKMQEYTNQRSEALYKVPEFSEYNAAEKQRRKKEVTDKINGEYGENVRILIGGLEVKVSQLQRQAFTKRYPLLSKESLMEESQKLRGAIEYNTAVALFGQMKTDFPQESDLKEFIAQGRQDLTSALIDLGVKKRTNSSEETTNKQKFLHAVNSVNKATGVWDLQHQSLELTRTANDVLTQYQRQIGGPGNEMLLSAAQDLIDRQNFKQALDELNV